MWSVATLSTDFKRLLLRGIGWDAKKNGLKLEEALRYVCQGKYQDNGDGRSIIATSGNGAAMQFALPQSDVNISPESVSSSCSELYDRYESAKADLVTEGTASPTDESILAEMLDRLIPIRSSYSDRRGVAYYNV